MASEEAGRQLGFLQKPLVICYSTTEINDVCYKVLSEHDGKTRAMHHHSDILHRLYDCDKADLLAIEARFLGVAERLTQLFQDGLLLEGNVTYRWGFGSLSNRLYVVSGSWYK